ncbi:hypothetical protein SEA_FAUST_256 [Streptomyces phage Faust]|uniref:Uncharacterized protein n=1 Tax=Streptomyces phage Faust TaxID=2767565 RepID=A0A7G9UZ73_9CAUD|nr:hypothetical protein PP456_gp031 [Streptomyces phage Faust]QNN99328.1 hypothetical protein SEA_FAUST_256 [Streptomyces phage Faust]
MKLFTNRKTILPKQIRPDYDSITKMEKEFRMDDQGFDERYDEMLLDEFNKVNKGSTLEFDEKVEKLYDLLDSMFSTKWRTVVTELINEARQKRWADSLGSGSIEQQAENLRQRMIAAGKYRRK